MGGNLRLELKPFDLVTVVNRGVEAVSSAAIGKQIQFEVRAPEPVPIVADPNRLQQVVWNLLSNALKFTPSGGTVTVDVGAVDGAAELCVEDTGRGIPARSCRMCSTSSARPTRRSRASMAGSVSVSQSRAT
jgi:signal transduction histidine kinase